MTLNEVIDFCLSLEGSFKRYPFPIGQNPLMMSVPDKKMFCAIFECTDPLHIIVKSDPVEALYLRSKYSCVKPGYHCNKLHWNSIYIDDSIPDEEIKRMISDSYNLVKKKVKRASKS